MAVEAGRFPVGCGQSVDGQDDRRDEHDRRQPDQRPGAPAGHPSEPAPADPAETDPADDQAARDERRRHELRGPARVREHRPQAAVRLLDATSATIATTNPRAPTIRPMRPKVCALEASSATSSARASAAVRASSISPESLGTSRSIRSASSPVVGASTTGNEMFAGSWTSENVSGPETNVSSTSSPSIVPDEVERVLARRGRDEPRAVLAGRVERGLEREQRRLVAVRDLDLERVGDVQDRVPRVHDDELHAVHLAGVRRFGSEPDLELEVADPAPLVGEGGRGRQEHQRREQYRGRQEPLRSDRHDEPPTCPGTTDRVARTRCGEGASSGGRWAAHVRGRDEQEPGGPGP